MDVYAGPNGTVFAYRFGAIDASGTGDNGVAVFSIGGFAGLDIDVGWNFAAFPAVPDLSRSADGDTITIDFLDILTTLSPTETLLFATNASGFQSNGTGTAALEIDSFGTTVRTFDRLLAPGPAPIPLPASGLLLVGALGAAAVARRRARRTAARCPRC